jgi:hypothetical protein
MASADRVRPLISMSRRPHARRAVSRPRWRSPRRLYVVLNREHDPGLRRRSPSDQLSPRGVTCRMGEMAGEAAERLHRRRHTAVHDVTFRGAAACGVSSRLHFR